MTTTAASQAMLPATIEGRVMFRTALGVAALGAALLLAAAPSNTTYRCTKPAKDSASTRSPASDPDHLLGKLDGGTAVTTDDLTANGIEVRRQPPPARGVLGIL